MNYIFYTFVNNVPLLKEHCWNYLIVIGNIGFTYENYYIFDTQMFIRKLLYHNNFKIFINHLLTVIVVLHCVDKFYSFLNEKWLLP